MSIFHNFNHPAIPSRFDSDALAYIAAVETADTQALETYVKAAINNFVVGCKSDGIWDAIKASCILAGARTLNGALVPLKGAAPTNNGPFVSGDYNRKTGLKGNGSTKYLNSNRNNNADPQNSHHLVVWITEPDNGTTNLGLIGCGTGENGSSHIGYATNSTKYFLRSRSASAFEGSTIARQNGFHGISRTSSTNINIILPNTASTTSITSQTPLASNIIIFGRQTSSPFWNGKISFYSIGESINLGLFNNRISNLMNTLDSIL